MSILVPFGAVVIFKPSPTKWRVDKPRPIALHGVFLGHRFALGDAWGGEYLVGSLEHVSAVDFSHSAVGRSKILAPRVAKHIRLPSGAGFTFALTTQADKVNFTIE